MTPFEWFSVCFVSSSLFMFIPYFISVHQIKEGYVGVYYRGGALLSGTSKPGFHMMVPLITTYHPVQISLQTDEVKNVPCGTSGGVVIYFENIQVVNLLEASAVHDMVRNYSVWYDKVLIHDRVRHEVDRFCRQHTLNQVYIDLFAQMDGLLKEALQRDLDSQAPGLHVQSVVVPRPKIPEQIRQSYEFIEQEKTKLLIYMERQKLVEKEAESEKKKAVIEAEKVSQVAMVQWQQKILQKQSEQKLSELEDAIHLAKEKAKAEAELYKVELTAQGNKMLLTPEYLELKRYEAVMSSSKLFFGTNIPNVHLSAPAS